MIRDKIDLHAHYLPPAYLEYLKKYVGEHPDNYKLPSWSEEAHIRQMNHLGAAFSFISISYFVAECIAGRRRSITGLCQTH